MSGYVRDASLRSGIFQTRRGPAASVAALVLEDGEPGYEVDTGRFVVGDGSTRWASLPSEGHGAASDIGVSGLTSLVGSNVQDVLGDVDVRVPALEAGKAPKASPTLTGTVTIPTASGGDNTTKAASTAYVQGELVAKAPLESPALTGNPTAPTAGASDNSTKIATTAYTDAAVAAGLAAIPSRQECLYAAATALPTNTYANGSSGTGATLTANVNGALMVDGQLVAVGQRILVPSEAALSHNGIYVVTAVGDLTTPYMLTRSTDFDQASEMGVPVLVPINSEGLTPGATNDKRIFLSVTSSPFVVGTTSLTFSLVGAAYTAGSGLTLSGTVFTLSPDTDSTFAANSDLITASQKAVATAFATDRARLDAVEISSLENADSIATLDIPAFICTSIAEVSIRATVAAARFALGVGVAGAKVLLPDGGLSGISWTGAALPHVTGLWYEGVMPRTTAVDVIPKRAGSPAYSFDTEITFTGGTWFNWTGGGSPPDLFAGENLTDLAQCGLDITATEIRGAGIHKVGAQGFRSMVRCGAANVMGAIQCSYGWLIANYSTDWSFFFKNFARCNFAADGPLLSYSSAHGMLFASDCDVDMTNPGNSYFGHLYLWSPRIGRGPAGSTAQNARGIVFACLRSGQQNDLTIARLGSNRQNNTIISATATFTSGSPDVAVADISQYRVDYPVAFTSTSAGSQFKQGYTYVVRAVSGTSGPGTLQLSSARLDAGPIVPTFSGTLTMETSGFANVEIVGNAVGSVSNISILEAEIEVAPSVGLYVEKASIIDIHMPFAPVGNTNLKTVILRTSVTGRIWSGNFVNSDIDAGSNGVQWFGRRSATSVGYPGTGMAQEGSTNGSYVVHIGTGQPDAFEGELSKRGNPGYIYPAQGFGERVSVRDAALALTSAQNGVVVAKPTADSVFTLPTIVTDTTPVLSNLGMWYEIRNVSTAFTITLSTDGTQTFNKVTGLTSISVPPGTWARALAVKDSTGALLWALKTQVHAARDHAIGGIDPVTPAAIGATPVNTLRGKAVAAPDAGHDQYVYVYDLATDSFIFASAPGGGSPDASATVKGVAKLSVAPASAIAPIAVGDNDPRVAATTTKRQRLWKPTQLLYENFSRDRAMSALTIVSGTLQQAGGIVLEAGVPVNSVLVESGSTAAATMTHAWFALIDQSLNVLAKTTDNAGGGTGDTSSGTNSIANLSSASSWNAGDGISGSGIPTGATVMAVNIGASSLTIGTYVNGVLTAANATLTASGVTLAPAWAASTLKVLSFASAYTPVADIAVRVGIVVVATTTPTLTGLTIPSVIAGMAPMMAATSNNAALTNPASLGAATGAIAAGVNLPYCGVA